MEQLSAEQRLVKYGFFKSGHDNYKFDKKKKFYIPKNGVYNRKDAEVEEAEQVNVAGAGKFAYMNTGFPKTHKRFRLIYEAQNLSIEETYFWVLGHLRQDQAFHHVDKITDIFSASENSSMFGQSAQRLGIQQDKVSQYLVAIGKMVKELFPMVRELRIIDERLEPYSEFNKKAADVTLKGIYVDLVEGGAKSPGSVFGMATQIGFTALPDLFFNVHITDPNKIDEVINELKINEVVKNVLRRKFYAFLQWKVKTEKELSTRRLFTLKYLRQHWEIVKMYMSWIKPYLRNVNRMSMNSKLGDTPDLISSFETSVTELEILARKQISNDVWSVVLATFNYRTKPTMSYQADYQRGPQHIGQVEFNLRTYGWTKDQIDNYKRLKQEEDMQLIGAVDESIQESMEAFGEELDNYLIEAGAYMAKEEQKELDEKRSMMLQDIADPFISLGKGFLEIFQSISPVNFKTDSGPKGPSKGDISKAKKSAFFSAWMVYNNYKKSHGCLSW